MRFNVVVVVVVVVCCMLLLLYVVVDVVVVVVVVFPLCALILVTACVQARVCHRRMLSVPTVLAV